MPDRNYCVANIVIDFLGLFLAVSDFQYLACYLSPSNYKKYLLLIIIISNWRRLIKTILKRFSRQRETFLLTDLIGRASSDAVSYLSKNENFLRDIWSFKNYAINTKHLYWIRFWSDFRHFFRKQQTMLSGADWDLPFAQPSRGEQGAVLTSSSVHLRQSPQWIWEPPPKFSLLSAHPVQVKAMTIQKLAIKSNIKLIFPNILADLNPSTTPIFNWRCLK